MSEYKTSVSGDNAPIGENLVVTITADKTLSYEDSGSVFLVGTDALTITLPATKEGVCYTFINSGVAGNNIITVSPQAEDGISGTVTLAGTVVVLDGALDADVINTKATSEAGDTIKVIGTGVAGKSGWIATSSTGIWAKEA